MSEANASGGTLVLDVGVDGRPLASIQGHPEVVIDLDALAPQVTAQREALLNQLAIMQRWLDGYRKMRAEKLVQLAPAGVLGALAGRFGGATRGR